jgi:hypothetical protein
VNAGASRHRDRRRRSGWSVGELSPQQTSLPPRDPRTKPYRRELAKRAMGLVDVPVSQLGHPSTGTQPKCTDPDGFVRGPERSRIEHAADARITFTIALHGEHAWEMVLEDSDRYHSISHGWATENPHDWEEAIAPLLRRLFVNGRLGFATKVPMYDSPNASSLTLPCMIPRSVAPQHALKPI